MNSDKSYYDLYSEIRPKVLNSAKVSMYSQSKVPSLAVPEV